VNTPGSRSEHLDLPHEHSYVQFIVLRYQVMTSPNTLPYSVLVQSLFSVTCCALPESQRFQVCQYACDFRLRALHMYACSYGFNLNSPQWRYETIRRGKEINVINKQGMP
jgi:hypothetical protein